MAKLRDIHVEFPRIQHRLITKMMRLMNQPRQHWAQLMCLTGVDWDTFANFQCNSLQSFFVAYKMTIQHWLWNRTIFSQFLGRCSLAKPVQAKRLTLAKPNRSVGSVAGWIEFFLNSMANNEKRVESAFRQSRVGWKYLYSKLPPFRVESTPHCSGPQS